ncbi:MAG: hypothetical protein OEL66_00200 [Desulfobulbaceae bacterium]|nr:hypothetical protein [Desulfobulbaceae bacterium]
MGTSITARYEKTLDGRRIIDVTIDKIEELYDRFDSIASYKKKDLDEEFVEYLSQCAKELKNQDFLLRINMQEEETKSKTDRLRSSIHHYFAYLQELERRQIKKHLTRACCLLGLGITLVFISLSLGARYDDVHSILKDIGIEGVTIVAWVSVWEAATDLIFEWWPHFQRGKRYEKIAASEILFRHIPQQ